MSKDIRKQYDGAFKLKVVLETYKNEKTLAQIASEYQVHATQIHIWKNQFKEQGPAIFQKVKDQEKAELKELVDELYKQIGQLKVERDWLKKNLKYSAREKVLLLEKDHQELPLKAQCELLGIARSTAYYSPEISEKDLLIMNEIDKIFTAHPYYGKRRMCVILRQMGYAVGVKYIRTLMRRMCLQAIYPKKNTSIPNPAHKVYPYLLKNVEILKPDQVWSTDITYIRLGSGFVYLVAIIDWYSRYVISWKLSITMEKEFCIEALEEALSKGLPEIFNSDQGSQFTSLEFTKKLEGKEVQISMDGKGRCLDNIFVERLWRSVKYEETYLKNYTTPLEALKGLKDYFHFYNHTRPHQSLNYKTPAQMYFQNLS